MSLVSSFCDTVYRIMQAANYNVAVEKNCRVDMQLICIS